MNKASGGDGIPAELFQSQKMMLWKCSTQFQQIWKTQQWPQDWKRSVFIPIRKKGNAKECSNYCTIALISHASKVMFKILKARLQQYMNRELPDVQAGFRKGRRIRDQNANMRWTIKKAREFQKNIYFCFIVEKAMAPHSGTLAWEIPWTEKPGRLQSMGLQESDTTGRLHKGKPRQKTLCHIYALVYCIGVFLSGLLHSV